MSQQLSREALYLIETMLCEMWLIWQLELESPAARDERLAMEFHVMRLEELVGVELCDRLLNTYL